MPHERQDFAQVGVGDDVLYYSSRFGQWISATIVKIDARMGVELDVKPGSWVTPDEFSTRLRKVSLLSGHRDTGSETGANHEASSAVQQEHDPQHQQQERRQQLQQQPAIPHHQLHPQSQQQREHPDPQVARNTSSIECATSVSDGAMESSLVLPSANQAVHEIGLSSVFEMPKPLEPQRQVDFASAARSSFKKGERVAYHSESNGGWIEGMVVGVNRAGDVLLDVKAGSWIRSEEQDAKLRRIPAVPGALKSVPDQGLWKLTVENLSAHDDGLRSSSDERQPVLVDGERDPSEASFQPHSWRCSNPSSVAGSMAGSVACSMSGSVADSLAGSVRSVATSASMASSVNPGPRTVFAPGVEVLAYRERWPVDKINRRGREYDFNMGSRISVPSNCSLMSSCSSVSSVSSMSSVGAPSNHSQHPGTYTHSGSMLSAIEEYVPAQVAAET